MTSNWNPKMREVLDKGYKVLLIVLLLVLIWEVQGKTKDLTGWGDKAYKVSLVGTFFALIWYAFETRKIRQISQQQRDLQQMPAMMIYFRQQGGTERPVIRNVGFGIAFGVDILKSTVEEGKWEFRYRLADNNNTLVPGEERQIGVNLRIEDEEDDRPLEHFQMFYETSRLQRVKERRELGEYSSATPIRKSLRIRFKDLSGRKYETSIRFSDNGITLDKPPRRI